jgi:hypothetical protein
VSPVIRSGPSIFDGPEAAPELPGPREVVTLRDGSDEEITEAIAAHLMVQPGERPMRPVFGTESMAFGTGPSDAALALQLAEHGWAHVSIESITPGELEEGYREFTVSWERAVTG